MVSKILSIKTESQVEFFLPVIEAYIEKLGQAFSQSKEQDLSQAVWQIILEDGHIGSLSNQHVLLNCWEEMSRFFKREAKLYGFIEEKQKGLTEMDYKVWLFFSPNIANNFFKNQIDRPKGFSTGNIITLPYIKLLEPVTEKLDRTLNDGDSGIIDKLSKSLNTLSLAEWFLDEADFTIFDAHYKKAIVGIVVLECEALIKEIKKPAATSVILEKRLSSLFKIAFRYFRAKNELETKYFKKLISEDPLEIEKGLKLAHKKASDYKKSLQQ